MESIRAFFAPKKASAEEYEPLTDDSQTLEGSTYEREDENPFSWFEYFIFAVLGVAMLWAWNMFLAAAPYFQRRFAADPWILENFQSSIISVSTVTNLTVLMIMTHLQSAASYPLRINTALVMNVVIFGLLTVSTSYFLDVSPGGYLAFLLIMVAASAYATGLLQNGAFSFAASFGRPEYTQAIMAGQGVAGVLPSLAQIISVLSMPEPPGEPPKGPPPGGPLPPPPPGKGASSAAFTYFSTAVGVSTVALVVFIPLVRRHNRLAERRLADRLGESVTSVEEAERASRRFISLPALLRKLHWLAATVFMCFVVTMFFPVFTSKILSVQLPGSGRLFAPGVFIPLGFFSWNFGDLLGRISTVLPISFRRRRSILFGISLARILFLPLYMLCNIRGEGAVVESDLFYLALVQFPFGLTNGWLGASTMMAAGDWVADSEREAAGGFMSLCLVAGLAVGSLLSFTASGI
ncbi:hypothetical protein GQ53DRAFT_746982 [Thozetella sp. PMI_491]|nr:hypothetical protein GQ53DRAFT_746982 [Thozetella sp. PMI_491]